MSEYFIIKEYHSLSPFSEKYDMDESSWHTWRQHDEIESRHTNLIIAQLSTFLPALWREGEEKNKQSNKREATEFGNLRVWMRANVKRIATVTTPEQYPISCNQHPPSNTWYSVVFFSVIISFWNLYFILKNMKFSYINKWQEEKQTTGNYTRNRINQVI